jgi:hypothetical protein
LQALHGSHASQERSKPHGLLKFQRPHCHTEQSTTGYSSLNDDSEYTLATRTVSVYTETKLPPRLIRKYQSRARTEALILSHIDASHSSSLLFPDGRRQSPKVNANNSSNNNNDTNSDTGSGSGRQSLPLF